MHQDRYVFVYGTLRCGEINDINRLRPAPTFLGLVRIRGTLYDLGPYPGVILGGAEWVQGEVYAISLELEQQLMALDQLHAMMIANLRHREGSFFRRFPGTVALHRHVSQPANQARKAS